MPRKPNVCLLLLDGLVWAVAVFYLLCFSSSTGPEAIVVRLSVMFTVAAMPLARLLERRGKQNCLPLLYAPCMVYCLWFGIWCCTRGRYVGALFPLLALLCWGMAVRSLRTEG